MSIHFGYYTPMMGFASSARKPPPALADFPLMKEFRSSGQFWLPEQPTQIFWGRVHYIPGNGTSITLEGNIASGQPDAESLAFSEVHGQLFNGAPCVLREVWGYVESFRGKADFFRSILHSSIFFFGMNPEVSAADSFAMSWLKLSHLDDWFKRPFSRKSQRDLEEFLVRFSPDKDESRAEFEGTPFKLVIGCSYAIPDELGKSRLEFCFSYVLIVVPDNPMSISWHMRLSTMIRELFMFLVGNGIYTLEMKLSTGQTAETDIHIYPIVAIPLVVRTDPIYFYSRYREIKRFFPCLLANWFHENERLVVVRHTLSELLTVDGAAPESIFTRVVQTLEHLHGIVSVDEGRYVPRTVWRAFVHWLSRRFPDLWSEGSEAGKSELLKHKEALIGRIGGINSFSFRTRVRALFDKMPGRELMPIIGNPYDAGKFLDEFLPRLEATRHYLTHFDEDQKALAFDREELEGATLVCWAVLVFTLARFLGLSDEIAGDLALGARKAVFFVRTSANL